MVAGLALPHGVAACQVVPTPHRQAGVGEAPSHRLGSSDKGYGHTYRTIHGKLNVLQLRHVQEDPVNVPSGDTGLRERCHFEDFVPARGPGYVWIIGNPGS